jgi:hypothetical protein
VDVFIRTLIAPTDYIQKYEPEEEEQQKEPREEEEEAEGASAEAAEAGCQQRIRYDRRR